MGLGSSKCEDFSFFHRPKKRLKSNEEEQNISYNCNNLNQQGPLYGSNQFEQSPKITKRPEWERLPYVALVEIYRALSSNDKYNASLACKSWLEPFSRPALWRRGNFRFNGVDDWRALCFASMMGGSLRHVTADCSATGSQILCPAKSADNLAVFLTSLNNSTNRCLATFRLTHMRRMSRYLVRPDHDVIRLLKSLLKAQVNLKILDLTNAGLSVPDGLELLVTACFSCAASLESLSISDLMIPPVNHDVAGDGTFLFILSRLKNLTELGISHNFLSDNVLFLISGTVPGRLKLITVWAFYLGRAESRTTHEAWEHLRYRCPNLRAEFSIKGVSHDRSFSNILTPSIPLFGLHWNSGTYTTMVNTKQCIDHFTNYFQHCLQHLTLDLHYAFLEDEEDMGVIVEKCLSLESLSVTSNLILPPHQMRLGRAIRRALMRQPASRLRVVTINGQQIDLEETWLSSVVGWLVEHVN